MDEPRERPPGGPAAADPASDFVLLHYRLLERIGTGGMSEVWRAFDTRLRRDVALKLLPLHLIRDPERLAMFRAEARTVAALSHPHIVTLYSLEESEGLPFLTMELVDGRTLAELIPRGGLPLAEFLDLALPIARAAGAAHERGIVHGDLKPGNVMVTGAGTVKVLDFGLARVREGPRLPQPDDSSTATINLTGGISGTLSYMSPEQLQGRAASAVSDVFALGVLFFEMLSGTRPFVGETLPDLMAAILRDSPGSLGAARPDLPRHLQRVVSLCLAKDPALRPRDGWAVARELELVQRSAAGSGPDLTSIAVLPFADLSPERDQAYFCEGIAEEILNSLARVRGLRVASRTSTRRFKGAPADVREIADRLGVGTVLEGSVRKHGSRLRISAHLTNGADGCQLWSGRYDRELRDVFAIQDEIALAIVEALEVTLSPRERRALKQASTGDPAAYDCYLRGRSYFNQFRRRGIEFARQMFTRAIEHDAAYALAYAGLADCYSYIYLNLDRTEANRAAAEAASRRAVELDPDLAEAHAARGVALSLQNRIGEAAEEFEAALRLGPPSFETTFFYARTMFQAGRGEEAIRLYGRAAEIRPEDYQSPLLSGQILEDLGRASEAEAARRRGVRLAQERLDLAPDDVRALYMGANGLVALGERERGLAWAERALALEPDEPMLLYNLACIYSLARDADRALDLLSKAVGLGFSHRVWLEKDSNLDFIRDSPRFAEIVARLG